MTESTLYLTMSKEGFYFIAGTPQNSSHACVVTDVVYSHPNWLHQIFGAKPIAILFTINWKTALHGDDIIRLRYHPGRLIEQEHVLWSYLGVILKSGSAIATVVSASKKGPLRKMPPEDILSVGLNSFSSKDHIQNAADHLRDTRMYPSEGYYKDVGSNGTCFIVGKVRQEDLYIGSFFKSPRF
jgi:hypothetical protein